MSFGVWQKILLVLVLSGSVAAADDGEVVAAGEAEAIARVTALIAQTVQQQYSESGRAVRDAHRKHHGCVKAAFEVLPVPGGALNQGLFSHPARYSSWVRFSNGSGQVQDDRDGDGRGFALKVLGVEGKRLLTEFDDESTSQDFLLINHPVFFVRNAIDYVGFQEAVMQGKMLLWLMSPSRLLHESRIAFSIQRKKMQNPLESRYWSMTASKLGSKQMKFSVQPCVGSAIQAPIDGENRLRENLEFHLASAPACFDFRVQLRTDDSMSVEDPTLEWSEEVSPFETVARIHIDPQTPVQGEACETMSFNPWNGLADHRPLGSISRVRKEVYATISRLRHSLNGQPREEPRP